MSAVLLVLCRPWLVALPLAQVVRVLAAEETLVEAGAVRSELTSWPVRSLSAALGLADGPQVALVLVRSAGRSAALSTGRCLHVGKLPGAAMAMPDAALRGRRSLSCFPAGDLAGSLGLAPFGLLLDVDDLLSIPTGKSP